MRNFRLFEQVGTDAPKPISTGTMFECEHEMNRLGNGHLENEGRSVYWRTNTINNTLRVSVRCPLWDEHDTFEYWMEEV